MSLPRYDKYKDSGVEWLGEVPEHWNVLRLRFVSDINPSKLEVSHVDRDTLVSFLPMEAIGNDGSLDLEREKAIREVETGYTFFRNGDVAIAKITPCFENGKGALMMGLKNDIGFGTTELIVARPKKHRTTGTYLYRIFRSEPFMRLGEAEMYGAGGQKRVPDSFVSNFAIGLPQIEEQSAIAAFLDRETCKIDALVEEQQRLIELLKEKRQAVISHAVTKGLNSDAPMQDSGIEWLGSVPSHWGLKATKKLFRLVVEPAPDDNDCELLSIYTEIGVRPRKDLEAKGNKATTTDGYWLVKKDDLIVNKLLAWMGAIGISDYDGVTSPAYDILRARIPLEPRFYDFLFRCGICFSEFRRYSRGIMDMRLRLYFDELGQLPMPYPPVEEQRTIVRYLQAGLTRIDELTAEATRAIDLLEERRTALISAAVTGKIDVRGLATEDAA